MFTLPSFRPSLSRGTPGYRTYTYPASAAFATGRGRFLQLLGLSCVTVLSLPPRRSPPASSACQRPCCLRRGPRGSAYSIRPCSRILGCGILAEGWDGSDGVVAAACGPGGRGAVGSCGDCPLETPPTSFSSGRPSSPASWLAHASPPFVAAFGGPAPCVGRRMGWHHTQRRCPRQEQAMGIAGTKEGDGRVCRVSAQGGKRLAGTNQEVTQHVAPCLVSGDRRSLIRLLHVPVRVVTKILQPDHIFLPRIRLARSCLACFPLALVAVTRGRARQILGAATLRLPGERSHVAT